MSSENGKEIGFRLTLDKATYDALVVLSGPVDVKVAIVAAVKAGIVCGRNTIIQEVREETNRIFDAMLHNETAPLPGIVEPVKEEPVTPEPEPVKSPKK